MNKKYLICEAPLCVGAPTSGSEYAFSHLIKKSLRELLSDRADFSLFGVPLGEGVTTEIQSAEEAAVRRSVDVPYPDNLRDAKTVMYINRMHYRKLISAFDRGYFPVTVGGDHSIAMSSIAALADKAGAENTAVVYVDGHADINTEKTSESGYIHGMPLAAAMGLCCDELTVGENKVSLFGKNTYIIGARSIDDGEYPIIEKEGVTLYTARDVKRLGYGKIIDDIAAKTAGMSVHLSFDVDSIDGGEFPATGYVMPDGLDFKTVLAMLGKIMRSLPVRSADFVEYNPSLDKDGASLEKMMKVFSLL